MEVSCQLHVRPLGSEKEDPGTNLLGGWVGPRADLDGLEKSLAPFLDTSSPSEKNEKEVVKGGEGMEDLKDGNKEEKIHIHTAVMEWYCWSATSRCVMSRK
jgi:hypothetical protein